MLLLIRCLLQIIILFSCGANIYYNDGSFEIRRFQNEENITYICKSYGSFTRGNSLSWYQITQSGVVLLQKIQLPEIGYMEVAVTTQKSGNGTEIYCAKEWWQRQGLDKISTGGILSKIYQIIFVDTQKLELKRLHFKVDDGLRVGYSCKTFGDVYDYLSWYQINEPYHVVLRTVQRTDYGFGAIEVTANITLRESDNGTHIYCAKYKESPVGFVSDFIVSELVPITFPDKVIKQGEDKFNPLPVVITLAVIVVISSVVAATWLLRRRRQNDPTQEPEKTQETQKHEENIYSTAQVTYAELQFKRPDDEYASSPAQESGQYTQIIGVLNPNRR